MNCQLVSLPASQPDGLSVMWKKAVKSSEKLGTIVFVSRHTGPFNSKMRTGTMVYRIQQNVFSGRLEILKDAPHHVPFKW